MEGLVSAGTSACWRLFCYAKNALSSSSSSSVAVCVFSVFLNRQEEKDEATRIFLVGLG